MDKNCDRNIIGTTSIHPGVEEESEIYDSQGFGTEITSRTSVNIQSGIRSILVGVLSNHSA